MVLCILLGVLTTATQSPEERAHRAKEIRIEKESHNSSAATAAEPDPAARAAAEKAAAERRAKAAEQKTLAAIEAEKAAAARRFEQSKAEEEAKKAAEEAKRKYAEDVPAFTERVGRKVLGRRYVSSNASWVDDAGWSIWIRGDAHGYSDRPHLLRLEMLEMAALCHPAGMKVKDLTLIYESTFTDGLGNNTQSKLLQCELIPGIAQKVNWGDKKGDLYNLDFAKIFATTFSHQSYRAEWPVTAATTTTGPTVDRKPLPRSIPQMVSRINEIAVSKGMGFRLTERATAEGSVRYKAGAHATVSFLSSDGERCHGAFLVAKGDGSASSGTEIALASATLLLAADPKLNNDQAGKAVTRMITEASETGNTAKADGHACSFSVTFIPNTAVIFTVDPK